MINYHPPAIHVKSPYLYLLQDEQWGRSVNKPSDHWAETNGDAT